MLLLAWVFAIASNAWGQDPNGLASDFQGEVRFRYDNYLVNKDRGRFREDNWMPDKNSGGLDRLFLKSRRPDENGYKWTIKGSALTDYDYSLYMKMNKKDSHYLLLDFSSWRRYYDGSNEYWDSPVTSLVEKDDYDFFTDRRNYKIEFGITPKEGTGFIFGWHRLVKDGKEVLLRGADAKTPGDSSVSAVPVVNNVNGTTDTLYIEALRTFAEKYNFRIRQEFEQYRDNQRADLSSFDSAGAIDNTDIQQDHLGYTNWRTMLMFDSFVDEETYVTANYMYNYLNNDSTRDIVGYQEHTTDQGGNSRRTNVGAFAYLKDNLINIEELTLNAGVRFEDSKTRSIMYGSSKYYNFISHGYTDPAKPRIVSSSLDEVRVEETLRLTYYGIERTTLTFDADLEQRTLGLKERDRHGGVYSDPDNSLKSDISFLDQIYTFIAVRRFNPSIRSTAQFRIKDLDRNYSNLLDDTEFYPGYLGSFRKTGRELTLKTDWRMNDKASSAIMYQFLQESIDTSLGGKTQNMEIHRGAGSVSLYPTNNLYLVGSFMLENYRLDTPAVGVAANHAQGASPYDFRGNSYTLLLDGNYAFNDRTSCGFGVQHTEATGEVDFGGNYIFDKFHVNLKYKIKKDHTLEIGYQFLNFNSGEKGSFDDYRAHGLSASYSYKF